jgi:hypothetical protein
MKRIWYYPLEPLQYTGNEKVILKMPGWPEMLSVRMIGNIPHVYALVTPQFEELRQYFSVYGTGEELPMAVGNYVGSFERIMKVGTKTKPAEMFVGHVFITHREVGRKEEEG